MNFNKRFAFWRMWLLVASIAFAFQSLVWMIIGSFDPWGFYDKHAANFLFSTEVLPDSAARLNEFILGPFGATNSGFFVLIFFLAKFGLREKERWPYWAMISGIGFWFVADTLFCPRSAEPAR